MSFVKTIRKPRLWINRSIQRQLLFWSLGFWVVSLTFLILTILWVSQTAITNETRQRNVQLASVVSRDVNSQISSIFADTRTFSSYLAATSPDLNSQAAALLALRLSSPHRYQAVYYFDNQGSLQLYLTDTLSTLLTLHSSDIVDRPPIQVDKEVSNVYKAAEGQIIYLSDVRFTGMDDVPVLYMGVPITLVGGEVRTVVYEIDLTDIWQRIDLSTIGQSGFTYAVSRDGVIIAYPEPASIGRLIPPEISPVLTGFEGYTEYIDPSNNRELIAAYSPVGGPTGWGIVVVQDRSEAYAPIIRSATIVIGIWLVLALLGTIGILITIRNFTRPIVKLTQTTHAIAETGDLTKTAMIRRPDEVGQLSQAFDQMIERLDQSEIRLAHAAAEERNRLARDLHDAVSQTLFSASLIAEVVPRLWDRNQPEARRRLEEVRQLTRGALAEMRTLLLELRPSSLVDAEIGYLMRQLGEAITGRSRIPVTVTVDGQCHVPTEVKIAMYRIAQESLNNVAKHSGAQEAKLSLACEPNQVTLKVMDNGKGFNVADNSNKSLGMGIIRERAREIGAILSIQSQMNKGTEISVVWKNGQ